MERGPEIGHHVLIDAIEQLTGSTREQNECSVTWTINSLHGRIETMGRAGSEEYGIETFHVR
jgi:hypothetical protein